MLTPAAPVAVPALIPIPAMNPQTGMVTWTVHVEQSMLEHLRLNGPAWKFYNAALICEAVESPGVILQGLNRPGFSGAYCYSRSPSCRWISEEESRPPRPSIVFVVFVSAAPQPAVLDWEYRLEDKKRPGYPLNWNADFTRVVWPSTP
jgi:hypothetical protein